MLREVRKSSMASSTLLNCGSLYRRLSTRSRTSLVYGKRWMSGVEVWRRWGG